MKLSIVIPTKNEEKNISRLLRDIRDQSFKDYEVIVADAKSTDRTVEIARSFGAQVVKGGLPGIGRNAGAKAAKGDCLFFLDADVSINPTFIERTLRKFQDQGLDAASCLVIPISEKRIDKLLHEFVNFYFKATEKYLPHAPGFCILVKRAIHERVGGFDESVVLAEDHDYVQRIAKIGRFRFLTEPRIRVSVRRLQKDGRLTTAVKYLLVEAYILFIGEVRSEIFTYKFAHFEEKEERFRDKLKNRFLNLAQKKLPTSREELVKIYNDIIDNFRNLNGKQPKNN